jgi:predicted membrane protein
MKSKKYIFNNVVGLFVLTVLISLLISSWLIFEPITILIIVFFVFAYLHKKLNSLVTILIFGFIYDGSLGYLFGFTNLIFLEIILVDFGLKKFINLNNQRAQYYPLILILNGLLLSVILNYPTSHLIPYLIVNLIIGYIYFHCLMKYG